VSLFSSIKRSFAPKAPPPTQASVSTKPAAKEPPSTPNRPWLQAGRAIDWRVLFIGSDARWFQQAEHDVYCLQPNWLCQRAADSAEARVMVASAAFDALVLDSRVSDKADLLGRLGDSAGRMVCLVCCNLLDRSAVAQWNRPGIIPVSEASDAATMVANLIRADRLRSWMADPTIKSLIPRIHKLPAAPKLHAQVTEELQSANGSMMVVARLISQDPVMSAKILQVANSAFFGQASEIVDTAEAAMVLGTERIRSLILLAGVFSQYDGTKCPGFLPEPIWNHSVQVAMYSRAIAFAETKDARMAEASFTAGLLHDIGKLILAANIPEMYATVLRVRANRKITCREAELGVFGMTHAELGACLLASWGLPLPILEAIAWHHEPEKSANRGYSLVAAVHVANAFAQENSAEKGRDGIRVGFLLKAGLGDCRNRWREFCGLAPQAGEDSPDERSRPRRAAIEN
jgi:putative nucleotidyltransferase with HDIG domain